MVLPEKARLMVVPSSVVRMRASLYPATPRASGVAMNRVPTHTPSAPRANDGGQSPPVDDSTGRHDRDVGADGVDHLGDQRHGGHLSGVAAGLGPLGHHDVAAGVERPSGVLHLAAHVDHEHAVTVAELDDARPEPPARPRTRWPLRR